MQKITPFLWFNDNAEEAMTFYAAAFAHSEVGSIQRYGEGAPTPSGTIMTATITLEDQEIMLLNGGPMFTPTPAFSFYVSSATPEETEALWAKLSEGAKVLMPLQKYPFSEKYGWLNDKFGVSWQLFTGKGDRKITPFLFFCGPQNGHAEEAMKFYVSIFENSGISSIARYPAGMGEPETAVVHGEFTLEGQPFMAMENGGPHQVTFTEATSLCVSVETQEENDRLWDKLCEGGEESQCGWLKDKFGVSWQITPKILNELLSDPDKAKASRAMQAMLGMRKLDIAALKKAFEGR